MRLKEQPCKLIYWHKKYRGFRKGSIIPPRHYGRVNSVQSSYWPTIRISIHTKLIFRKTNLPTLSYPLDISTNPEDRDVQKRYYIK